MTAVTTAAPPRATGPTALGADAVRALLRSPSAATRTRRRAVVAASAGLGVVAVLTTAVATLPATTGYRSTPYVPDAAGDLVPDPADHGLISFLTEAGLRPGVVLAAVLLALPVLALLVQAVGLGSAHAARRTRALAAVGATRGDLRRLAVVEHLALFGLGGLLAGPGYAALWLLLGVLPPRGLRVVPAPTTTAPLAWAAAAVVITALGAVVGARRAQRTTRVARQAPDRRVLATTGLIAPIAAAGGFLLQDTAAVAVGLGVAVALALVTAGGVAQRRAARTAPRGRGPAALEVLAAAQLRGSPGAVGRAAGVVFACGLSFGVETALVAASVAQSATTDALYVATGAALAAAVGVVAAAVALVGAALSITDHLLSSGRAVAAVAALGARTDDLVAVQALVLRRTAVRPVLAGIAVGVALGAVATGGLGGSTGTLGAVVVGGLLAALVARAAVSGACGLVARLLVGRVRRASALEHLRTP